MAYLIEVNERSEHDRHKSRRLIIRSCRIARRLRDEMLEYRVNANRQDAHGSLAACKNAEILLDTDVNGRPDAFNPAELFLASIAACMIKGIERVTAALNFELRGVEVRLHGVRQDAPPRMVSVDYELIVDTDEDDHRLDLLHKNVRKYGTISNTVAAALPLAGTIHRRKWKTVSGAERDPRPSDRRHP